MHCKQESNSFINDKVHQFNDHSHLLDQVESGRCSFSVLINHVFSGNIDPVAHQNLLSRFELRIKEHESRIQQLCSGGKGIKFVNNLYDSLVVRVPDITTYDNSAQISDIVKCIDEQKEKLESYSAASNKLKKTANLLASLLPALQTFEKISKLTKADRLIETVKLIKILEREQIPAYSESILNEVIKQKVSGLRQTILAKTDSMLLNFTASVWGDSLQKIGLGTLNDVLESDKVFTSFEKRSKDVLSDSVMKPLYYSYTVAKQLDNLESFRQRYRQLRLDQLSITLTISPSSLNAALVKKKPVFYEGIIGHFTVEEQVFYTTEGLVAWSEYINGSSGDWIRARSAIINLSRDCLEICNCVHTLSQMRFALIGCLIVFTRLNFHSVSMIRDVLMDCYERYAHVLRLQWRCMLYGVMQEDSYQSMILNSKSEYDSLYKKMKYDIGSVSESTFPYTLPFSSSVPEVCMYIKEFIYKVYTFAEELAPSSLEDFVRRSTDSLFSDVVRDAVAVILKGVRFKCEESPKCSLSTSTFSGSKSISQIVQLTANLTHLIHASNDVAVFLLSLFGEKISPTDYTVKSASEVSSRWRDSLKDCLGETEYVIFNKLCEKIEVFMDSASYEWKISSTENNFSPSDYVEQVCIYVDNELSIMKDKFNSSMGQTACMSVFKCISTKLRDLLLEDDDSEVISLPSLKQFSVDLAYFAEYSTRTPIKDPDGIFVMCFCGLQQLVDLIIKAKYSEFLSDVSGNYVRVPHKDLLILLERKRAFDNMKSSRFSFLKDDKKDKERKALEDTVIKKLKAIMDSRN